MSSEYTGTERGDVQYWLPTSTVTLHLSVTSARKKGERERDHAPVIPHTPSRRRAIQYLRFLAFFMLFRRLSIAAIAVTGEKVDAPLLVAEEMGRFSELCKPDALEPPPA